jgi:hypothetical protein
MPSLWRGESDAEIAAALEAAHPSLRLVVIDGRRVVTGAFNVEHEGQFLAGFQVEVMLDVTDELGLPTVKEVAGRIPRVPERHVNKDGSACLYLPEELVVRYPEPFGIVAFLDGPVRNFFLGQAGVELGVPFPLGEWGHGADGMTQMLSELLGFDDVHTSIAVLELLSRKVIKGHWPCPCGSRQVLRKCHHELVQRLRHRLPLHTRRFLLARARAHLVKGMTTQQGRPT